MSFPKRPKSHVTGDRAVHLFKAACAPSWVVADVIPDYGLDLRIELTNEDQVIGQEIHVQVKGTARAISAPPSAEIRQATINYWLAKLAPVLIVLVDTTTETIWYDWLENAYSAYPKQRDTDVSVPLSLSHSAAVEPLAEEIPRHAARYYGRLGATTKNLEQRAQLLELLFHVVNLTNLFWEIWFYIGGMPTNGESSADMTEKLRLFYQKFGTHDLFLQNWWQVFTCGSMPVPVREAFESRMSAYMEIKKSFFMPSSAGENFPSVPILGSHHSLAGTIVFFPLRLEELLHAIGPAIHVLRDIDGLIFRLLLLGRIKFAEK